MSRIAYFRKYLTLAKSYKGLPFFHLGIFLLFSAPLLASFSLIVSIFINNNTERKVFYKNPWNYPLILSGFFMLISCYLFPLITNQNYLIADYSLSTHPYLGILNWIPLFIVFLRVQPFLSSVDLRKYCGFFLICSSIPVLFSGFGQEFLNWYGPIDLLNGLIIWYQRPNESGMTGVFNNPNYAGCVLATCLPFAIIHLKNSVNRIQLLIPSSIICFSLSFGIFLTTSRNALFCSLIGFIFLIKNFKVKTILFSSSLFFLLIFISQFFINYNQYLYNLNLTSIIDDPRVYIYLNSIYYIIERPLLGWGGNGFSQIWNTRNETFFGHSHNLFLEFSIQYGLLSSLILASLILFIIFKSFKNIFFKIYSNNTISSKDDFHEKAWFSSGLIIVLSNLLDIQYYDLRISLLFWILLAGMKNIADQSISNK